MLWMMFWEQKIAHRRYPENNPIPVRPNPDASFNPRRLSRSLSHENPQPHASPRDRHKPPPTPPRQRQQPNWPRSPQHGELVCVTLSRFLSLATQLSTPKSKHNSEVLPEFIILTSITQSILDFQIQKQKYSSNWSTMLLTTISKISSDITTTNKQLNKQNWWWRHEPLSHKACEEMLKLIQHLFLVAWVQYHFL